MALSEKRRHQLKLAAKRRSRRPQPSIVVAEPMKVKHRDRLSLTNSNPHLLLGLETLLVSQARASAGVDDRLAAQALRCLVQHQPVPPEIPDFLLDALQAWIEANRDAPFALAMRIVYESIQTRSTCQPGEQSYLNYARKFISRVD